MRNFNLLFSSIIYVNSESNLLPFESNKDFKVAFFLFESPLTNVLFGFLLNEERSGSFFHIVKPQLL